MSNFVKYYTMISIPSTNLNVLIESIKISLSDAPHQRLITLLEDKSIDWQEIERLTLFHKIVPVLYDTFQKIQRPDLINTTFYDKCKTMAQSQVMLTLASAQEINYLLCHLEHHQIKAIPYKGTLFLHELYDKKNIRSGGDLDLVVKRKDLEKTLRLLMSEGYEFPSKYAVFFAKKNFEETIQYITNLKDFHEVSLRKPSSLVEIDLHWGFYSHVYPYKISSEFIFNHTKRTLFFNKNHDIPNKEAMFWMLIIHHGGRDVWINFKYLCDLLMFYKKFGNEIDWQKILLDAEKFKLKRIVLTGLYCLQEYFDLALPNEIRANFIPNKISDKLVKKISNYWKYAIHYDTLMARIKFETLFFAIQDVGFSYKDYFKKNIIRHANPNPFDGKRIFVLPKQYPILNLFGKVISYVMRSFKMIK